VGSARLNLHSETAVRTFAARFSPIRYPSKIETFWFDGTFCSGDEATRALIDLNGCRRIDKNYSSATAGPRHHGLYTAAIHGLRCRASRPKVISVGKLPIG